MDAAGSWTECLRCREGYLLPLSAEGDDGAALRYKAWVCSNPECGFNVRIDDGEITFGRDVSPSYR